MMKKNFVAVFIIINIFIAYAHAAEKPQWGLQALMGQLAQIETSRAKFVEVKYDPLLKRPLYLKGILKYQAPDYIRKETYKPFYNQFAVQGNSLTITREGGKSRTIRMQKYPSLWAFVEAFRATLRGDLKKLQRFYTVTFQGTEKRWILRLDPLNRRMKKKVRQIKITGRFAKIKGIEIIGMHGDRSNMTIVEQ